MSALTEAIRSGQLAPGQRLVETQLQQQFEAGRSSVREALQALAALGLVVIEANRGASVRRLSRADVVDLFVVRERLEGLGAGLAAAAVAAGRADAGALQALAKLMRRLRQAADAAQPAVYGQLNRELHRLLLRIAGNAELLRLAEHLSLPIFNQQFNGFLDPAAQRSSQTQHEAIVAAVLAGQPAAAERLMRAHVRRGLKLVQAGPALRFAPASAPAPTAAGTPANRPRKKSTR